MGRDIRGMEREGIGMRKATVAVLVLVAAIALVVASRVGAQGPMSFSSPAPELVGGAWLNTPKNKAIRLADRKGKVTIVEFWTFG